MAPVVRKKKTTNNAKNEEITDEDKKPGVVYIGHVPHGFYEKQMRQYFSQFGRVLSVKVSRSKKNGKSKGYAFIKFRYAAVAKTVADACHNYLFFNRLLKCEYKPLSEVHKDTFFSYKWRPSTKSKRRHNSAKSTAKLEESLRRVVGRQKRKVQKLKELGIDLSLEDVLNVPAIIPVKKETSSSPVKEMEVTPTTAEAKEIQFSEVKKIPKTSKKVAKVDQVGQETVKTSAGKCPEESVLRPTKVLSPKRQSQVLQSIKKEDPVGPITDSRPLKRKRAAPVKITKAAPSSVRQVALAKRSKK